MYCVTVRAPYICTGINWLPAQLAGSPTNVGILLLHFPSYRCVGINWRRVGAPKSASVMGCILGQGRLSESVSEWTKCFRCGGGPRAGGHGPGGVRPHQKKAGPRVWDQLEDLPDMGRQDALLPHRSPGKGSACLYIGWRGEIHIEAAAIKTGINC